MWRGLGFELGLGKAIPLYWLGLKMEGNDTGREVAREEEW